MGSDYSNAADDSSASTPTNDAASIPTKDLGNESIPYIGADNELLIGGPPTNPITDQVTNPTTQPIKSSAASAVNDLALEPDMFDELKRSDAVTEVHRIVTNSLESAALAIVNLCATASNERLKFDAAKYILELGQVGAESKGPESPIEKLIGEIKVVQEEAAKYAPTNHK